MANVSTGPGFMSWHGDPSFKKREKFQPKSYVTEEYKIRHGFIFVLRVAQFKKAKDFLYDELPTRAMEVRESQGSRCVRQGWSNATEESMGKSGREKKETKEGKKVAPAKATFRVSQTRNSFFWFTSIGVLRDPSRLKCRLLCYFFYEEAMCKGTSGNGLLNAAQPVP
jgi:hypothetical protein